MTRSNVVAILSFAVIFAAGFFVGQLGWAGSANRSDGASLTSQLDLTPKQQEEIRKIWSEELSETTRATEKSWAEAEAARDAAVRKLLTPDQLKAVQPDRDGHRAGATAFRSELLRKQLDAEAKTKSLLYAISA